MASQKQFEDLSLEFSAAQNRVNEYIGARLQLETQFQENKIVLAEFDALKDESKVYKLIGPVLLPQDQVEAKVNVKKRIEFIQDEIVRVEAKIDSEEKGIELIRAKIMEIRAKTQSQ